MSTEKTDTTEQEDAELGRLIRERGISVMRIMEEVHEGRVWSACNAEMSFDYGHNGNWAGGKTALEAARAVAAMTKRA